MKIGQKLIFGFTGIALLIGVAGGISLYFQNKIVERDTLGEIARVERNFLDIKGRDIKILSSALEVFVQDETFKEIYVEKDREKLYAHGQPLFQKLRDRYGITHFYFILPDGRCFLRLHNKDIHGDLITRFTFENARNTKKAASGIELGKTAFALRAVMPYYRGGELIGYVEFGEEIDHFLEILKSRTNDEFAIIADKKYLDREKWKSVRHTAGLRDNWDDLKEHVVIDDTTRGKIKKAGEFFTEESLERIERGKTLLRWVESEGKTFAGGGFDLVDAGGRHAGAVLSLVDMTSQAAITRKSELYSAIIAILLLGIALSAGLLIARSISGPIIRLKDATVALGKGKLDVRVEIQSEDEIGVLADSFNKMAQDLKKSKQEIEDYSSALEQKVEERTEELTAANEELQSAVEELRLTNEEARKAKEAAEKKSLELERFNKLAVGRELRMKELKARITELEAKLRG